MSDPTGDPRTRAAVRVGVDVGGTFTKAVAVTGATELRAQAVVPTTHGAADGVTEGVATALTQLLADPAVDGSGIELVAFSTTQAMNALLEGDVAKVGVVGIGRQPDLRPARKRTCVGDVALAPGRTLRTEHVFLDATGGLAVADVDAALDRLVDAGCGAIAASGAFAVDAPDAEHLVAARARERGLPTCAGHELSASYGLELRTVSAAINASILPLMERTAGVVARVLEEQGIDVPLLVLRGDGGAMSLEAFRRAPSFSIGAGPAAGVAAALHQLRLTEGIVVECGGTSSNVSVVERGRTVLRSLKIMGRPTAIRSVDSWVVGAAGGSMGRLRRRGIAEGGPRSAHIAGLGYACFADPADLDGAQLELVAPREGDPESYAALRLPDGRRLALTATCAANALGLVPAGSHALGSREAALRGFALLGTRLKASPERAAQALLDAVVDKIAGAVEEAAGAHDFGRHVPVVALGGSGEALAGGGPRLGPPRPRRRAGRLGRGAGGRGRPPARAPAAHARAPRGPVVDRRRAVARARRGRAHRDGRQRRRRTRHPRGRARVRRRRRGARHRARRVLLRGPRGPAACGGDRRRGAGARRGGPPAGRRGRAAPRGRRGARRRPRAAPARRRQPLLPRLLRERLGSRRRGRRPR